MATNPISIQQLRNASEDARDLERYVNDDVPALIPTRLGGEKPNYVKFLADRNDDFQQFLLSSGYEDLGDYGAGLSVESRNQVFRRDGELYRASAALELPYTTTGVWEVEGEGFVSVGDAALRQQLATARGSGMTGYSQTETYPDGSLGQQVQQAVSMGSARGGYIAAGVIRRDTSISSEWQSIIDSTHIPLNGLEPTGGSTDLGLSFKAGPVGAMICAPDETFALDGAIFGASGGGGAALMSIGVPCTFEIDLSAKTISKYNARYFAASRFNVSINVATGGITITHPPSRSHFRPVVQHSAANSLSEPLLPHYVLNSGLGSGSTTLQLLGEAEGLVLYNGTSWQLSTSAWTTEECTFAYDAVTGILTVTHPSVVGSPGLTITPYLQTSGTYVVAAAGDHTATGFKVRFRTLADGIPSLLSGLGFMFSRGVSAPRKAPTGTLLVDIGRVQAAASHVDAPSGNVWILVANSQP